MVYVSILLLNVPNLLFNVPYLMLNVPNLMLSVPNLSKIYYIEVDFYLYFLRGGGKFILRASQHFSLPLSLYKLLIIQQNVFFFPLSFPAIFPFSFPLFLSPFPFSFSSTNFILFP